jgi:UTP--glucose-1-phosphate uridylyltransferase
MRLGWRATLESIVLLANDMGAVQDAVLVAAGLGTRMFPSSAFLPKETLPLVDVPLLTHLALEARAAGIQRLHVVVSPTKSFDGMFDDRTDLHALRAHLDQALFNAAEGMEVHTHVQREPKGVGDAIQAALHAVDGPFLVMLGDNLLMDVHAPTTAYRSSQASRRLVEAHEVHGDAVVGLMDVGSGEVEHYGIAALDNDIITAIVEKPTAEAAPSTLALCGRYVFPAEAKAILASCTYEEHGDLQSIALQERLMAEGRLHGLVLTDTQWYDSGSPLKWLEAQVDHALRREDLAPAFATWLHQRLESQR